MHYPRLHCECLLFFLPALFIRFIDCSLLLPGPVCSSFTPAPIYSCQIKLPYTMVVFEVFGDSNIAKSWKAVASEQDRLKGSVLRQTTTQISLRDSLRTVAQTTRYILVAALSNPISRIKFEGVSLLSQAVTEKLDEIYDYLIQTINSCPDLQEPF